MGVLASKVFWTDVNVEPSMLDGHKYELDHDAAKLGRKKGIPLVESHPKIAHEYIKMVARLARVAIDKLKKRRVPVWVAFLDGDRFLDKFHELRDFMQEVKKEQVVMEALVRKTAAA